MGHWRARSGTKLRCHSHWTSTGEGYGRIGVNARLLDGFEVKDGVPMWDGRAVPMEYFDNADR